MEQVEELNVEDVKPYAKNPRFNNDAIDKVAESIKKFGFRQPILIDKDNTIIAGHTRLAAAKKLGLTTVPCIRCTDLTPKQVRALRLADNKTAEFSYWDMTTLIPEMDELKDDFDFSALGFDMSHFIQNTEINFSEEVANPENDVFQLTDADDHFNASLTYPSDFKAAYNAFIFKKGNREALIKLVTDYVYEQIKEQGIEYAED